MAMTDFSSFGYDTLQEDKRRRMSLIPEFLRLDWSKAMKITAVEMPQGAHTHTHTHLFVFSIWLSSIVEFGLTCLPVFESLLQNLCQSDLCSLV